MQFDAPKKLALHKITLREGRVGRNGGLQKNMKFHAQNQNF